MKKSITLFLLLFLAVATTASGQTDKQCLANITSASGQKGEQCFSYSTSLGTGIAMSEPSFTPFLWQVAGHYHLNRRLSVGAGTGISVYEKALIPLYASVQFSILKPKKLTPYLECNVGTAFAPDKEANGGFYLSPSLGVRWMISQKLKLHFSVGYELQELERLKKHTDSYFAKEFKEELSHHSISFKVGVTL